MFTSPIITKSHDLNELLIEALELPINSWISDSRVVVVAYYQEILKGDDVAQIRASTEVEKLELNVDAVITVSMEGVNTYRHDEMMVLLSEMLNMIECSYSGREATPAIFIKQSQYRVNPVIVKYFGKNNRTFAPLLEALHEADAPTYDEKGSHDEGQGMYSDLGKIEAPPIDKDGGMYDW